MSENQENVIVEEPVQEEQQTQEQPIEESVQEQQTQEQPIEEPVQEQQVQEQPIEESVQEEQQTQEQPVEEPVEEPVQEPVQEQVQEQPVEEPVQEQVQEQPVEEPVQEQAPEQPVEEQAPEQPVEEPVQEQAKVEPVQDSSLNNIIETENIDIITIPDTLQNLEINVNNILSNVDNKLEQKHRVVIKQLYNSLKDKIIEDVKGKSVSDLDFSFWMDALINVMIEVEKNYTEKGITKKDLVIETITLIIRSDLLFEDKEKKQIETNFRMIAPKLVETVIYASSNLNMRVVTENIGQAKSCIKMLLQCFKKK